MRASFAEVDVAGVPITRCRTHEVRELLRAALRDPQPCRIATVNLDFLRRAAEDDEFRELLLGCRYRFADGWPVLTLARYGGSALPERVTGSDLTPLICSWAAEEGWRIGLVGGSPSSAAPLAERLGRVCVGHWIPCYVDDDLRDAALAQDIAATGTDILLVGLGCPKQERWMAANLVASGARVAMGVGASIDFLAGVARRAPRVVQRLRAEFLWRMCREPRRLAGRYLKDAGFFAQELLRSISYR